MKFLNSRLFSVLAVFFLVTMFSACGYLISVEQLTDADNNTVVNLGDSIFALSGDIYTEIHAMAGETFRHYAVSGAQMIGGILAPDIPSQYESAKEDDPNIDIVYMDGGGNDILIPAIALDPYDCKVCEYFWCEDELSQSCIDLIDDLYVERVNLFNEMARDGVRQVVALGYYKTTSGTFGDLSELAEAVVYGNETIELSCQASNLESCVLVDPVAAFEGNESTYITSDGIHPTETGSKVLADMIWAELDL